MKILKDQSAHTTTRAVRVAIYIHYITYLYYTYYMHTCSFVFQAQCFLKFLEFEIEMFLINFGSHHHLKRATYSVHSFIFFFKSKVNWTFFPVEIASTLWVWFCLFWCKNNLGVKAFDLIRLHLFFFFNTLTVTSLLKHCSIEKRNFSSYVC